MTAIIAHRSGWMVSDSMAVAGDRIFKGPVRKMTKLGDHTLIGDAGMAGFETHAREALADAAEDRDMVATVLSDWMRENGNSEAGGYCLLLVNTKQELLEIDSNGAIMTVGPDFWCIGSGGEICQSYLAGVLSTAFARTVQLTPSHAEQAIAYCASSLTGIGGPCQTLSLYG